MEFYASELKEALDEYQEIEKQARKVADDKRKKMKLVKSLISVITFSLGAKATRELLEKNGLLELAQPFLDPEEPTRPIAGTVVRRRRGRKKIVDPENVLAKGTPIRMTGGKYQGLQGKIASSHAKKLQKGLDVTYFLALQGRGGKVQRTSVKHGTLGKTWEVVVG